MRNFKIVLQYEGTRYKGWQKQGKGEGDSSSSASPENTIQGKLERLLSRIAGKPVEIQGSGRTDAGVHAYGQVANFHMDTDDTPEALMEKINSYLPEDIGVISVEEVPERFHSRLNAKSKTYRYRVLNSAVPHIFERRYVYQVPEHLDMEPMRRAAILLTGSHDFKAFTSAKTGKKSTVRTVDSIQIDRVGDEIHFTFSGNGFLYHMVRILTGTLLEIGTGKRDASKLPVVIAAEDRSLAGFLAPARGLFLRKVYY